MPGFATRAIRAAGRTPDAPQPPVNVPIYQTSTFEVSSAQELADLLEFQTAGHSYSRYSNPTFAALEAALAELEGGEAAVVSGSGMAAIHAALASTLRPGDEVLAHRALYGGTYAILTGLFARFGVSARFLPLTDASAVAGAMTDRTRLIWAETIANPTTEMADLAALADLAHERKALLMVDNTLASPYLCNPLALGADLVVHSLTKYVGGHSDLIAGAVIGPADRVAAARHVLIDAGGNAQPLEAFLALRGLKTLAIRMDRHASNALAVACALEGRPLSDGPAGHAERARRRPPRPSHALQRARAAVGRRPASRNRPAAGDRHRKRGRRGGAARRVAAGHTGLPDPAGCRDHQRARSPRGSRANRLARVASSRAPHRLPRRASRQRGSAHARAPLAGNGARCRRAAGSRLPCRRTRHPRDDGGSGCPARLVAVRRTHRPPGDRARRRRRGDRSGLRS